MLLAMAAALRRVDPDEDARASRSDPAARAVPT
jgi:hypothetical protein